MTSTDDVKTRVIEILAEQALIDADDVKMTDTLEELGIDSLGLVECIFAFEEEFDITIPFNANEPDKSDFNISSVADIVSGIRRLKDGTSG